MQRNEAAEVVVASCQLPVEAAAEPFKMQLRTNSLNFMKFGPQRAMNERKTKEWVREDREGGK